MTFGEAAALAGEEFRHVLHVVAAEVGVAAEVTREYVRNGKPWVRRIQAYRQGDLLGALARRVSRTMNAEKTVRHPDVVTTAQIAETLRCPTDGRVNHAVQNCRPLDLPARDLPFAPYTLGLWLGDGNSDAARFTSDDPEIVMYVEAEGFVVRDQGGRDYGIHVPPVSPGTDGTCHDCGHDVPGRYAQAARCWECYSARGSAGRILRSLGVLGNKHIPITYLRASETQRRALLAGLMDSDGTVAPTGTLQYTSTSRRLAEDVRELISSLGYRCSQTTRPVKGRSRSTSVAYTLTFSTPDEVFRLERKRLVHKERSRTTGPGRSGVRYVTTSGRFAVCRCGVSRSTTTTTCTSPAGR